MIVTHDIDEATAMADRVLIMSANPGRIVGEVNIDLPYPRDRSSQEFSRQRESLMKTFDQLAGNHTELVPLDNKGKNSKKQEAA